MTQVLAHRGASADAPENTMSAFWLADAMGADGVELDVRRTADGCLAVHHDAQLADGRAIVEVNRHELPSHIPSLEAVLDACEAFAVVNIEMKDLPGEPGHHAGHPLPEMVAEVIAARRSWGRVIVSSFDLDAIDRLRAIDEQVPTALLAVVKIGGPSTVPLVERCAQRGHSAFHPHHSGVDAAVVARCHEAGLALNTWTVDEPGRIAELAAMGVDGIVTNRPDVALEALGRRIR